MKKYVSLILILLIVISSKTCFASSIDIVPINNKEETKQKGYPVIELKNTTDENILVQYDFYINEKDKNYNTYESWVLIPSNESVKLEIPRLSFLGETGEIRKVWFSWDEKDKLKTQKSEISTVPFDSNK